jgi:tetratricopeptide (TPR) repeat protein
LTLIDVPPPFRSAASQPDPSTPIEALLASGHFRSAAIKAAQKLTSQTISPVAHEEIFSLLYIRLSSLTLCNQTPLAAQEVKVLEDLNSSYYRDDLTGVHLVPWHLRVLAVRLQGMGYADARRGVMGYYDLAREARITLGTLKKHLKTLGEDHDVEDGELSAEIAIWQARLHDLGIRVASALIEMEDLEGAARFLKTLQPAPEAHGSLRLEHQKALLYLCLGDIDSARSCISTLTDNKDTENEFKVIEALAHIADADYSASAAIWEKLIAGGDGDKSVIDDSEVAMYRQNLAVCYLYLGRMDDVRLPSISRHHIPSTPHN